MERPDERPRWRTNVMNTSTRDRADVEVDAPRGGWRAGILTYGVHEARVDVGVEQVGHGQDRALVERLGRRQRPVPVLLLGVARVLTPAHQVHEQCEIPDEKKKTKQTNKQTNKRRGAFNL